MIHTLFTRLTIKPCKKHLRVAVLAMRKALIIKITSKNKDSIFESIQKTVAKAIARTKSDNKRISLISYLFSLLLNHLYENTFSKSFCLSDIIFIGIPKGIMPHTTESLQHRITTFQ
jgi:hypothetical protein